MKFGMTAEANTIANDGSQFSENVKNPRTFSLFAIPEIINPLAKIAPTTNATHISVGSNAA